MFKITFLISFQQKIKEAVNFKVTASFFALTLTKPTSVTLPATLFVHHGGFAAFGTQVADLHFGGNNLFLNRMSAIAVGFLFIQVGCQSIFLAQVGV